MLDDSQILDLWERGVDLDAVERALLVLQAAHRDARSIDWARLPIGRRDRLLLQVRAAMFGDALPCVIECAACDEVLEIVLPIAQLDSEPMSTTEPMSGPVTTTVDLDNRTVVLRAPDSRDLQAIEGVDSERGRTLLLERCVTADGAEPLSVGEVEWLGGILETLDPMADVSLAAICPACGATTEAVLDIAEYLWGEIAARARGLVLTIDFLARRYGWTESVILAMSEARREIYTGLP